MTQTSSNQQLRLGETAQYQIKIQGRLSESWTDWFDELSIESHLDGSRATVTVLTGQVRDQVALHGLLARIRDLGLPLLSVECLSIKNYKGE